ncbi:MAG: DUF397 domain-containing protein [Pseudonocardiaceae bacterium]
MVGKWRKSSYSTIEGNCLEFANVDNGNCVVRDSKDSTGPALMFPPTQWVAFIKTISRGDFG